MTLKPTSCSPSSTANPGTRSSVCVHHPTVTARRQTRIKSAPGCHCRFFLGHTGKSTLLVSPGPGLDPNPPACVEALQRARHRWSSAATQLFEPIFQNGLLAGRDACEHNPHSGIGELKDDFSACCKCGICARDSDHNLCALWRRIDHVQKASPGAQVAGPGAKLCFARDFRYFGICNDGIAWSTTALGAHSSPPSLVAKNTA